MAARKVLLLAVALMIAGGTMFVARGILSKPGSPVAAPKAPPTTEILVASKDIPSGALLTETDMKWQIWPKDETTKGYAVKGEAEMKDFTGTVARYGVRAGEPLTSTRVVKPGEHGFMAAALAPGMRAVSIAITPVAGVAGFVFPGDRVDVIVTHQVGRKTELEPSGRRVSETMLRNIRVLALDQRMNDQVTEPKVAQIATLEVTPKQAETLALVTELGTISLALRSIASDPEDVAVVSPPAAPAQGGSSDAAMTGAAALALGGSAAVPAVPAGADGGMTWDSDISSVLPGPANRRGAVQKIQIIRGKDVTESVFDLQP